LEQFRRNLPTVASMTHGVCVPVNFRQDFKPTNIVVLPKEGHESSETLILAAGNVLTRLSCDPTSASLFQTPGNIDVLEPNVIGRLAAKGTVRAMHAAGDHVFFVSELGVTASPAYPEPSASKLNTSLNASTSSAPGTSIWRRMVRLAGTSAVFTADAGLPLADVTSICAVPLNPSGQLSVEDYVLCIACGGVLVLVESLPSAPNTSLASTAAVPVANHVVLHLSKIRRVHSVACDVETGSLYFTDAADGSVNRIRLDFAKVFADGGVVVPVDSEPVIGCADTSSIDPSASFFSPNKFLATGSPALEASPELPAVAPSTMGGSLLSIIRDNRIMLSLPYSGRVVDLTTHELVKDVEVMKTVEIVLPPVAQDDGTESKPSDPNVDGNAWDVWKGMSGCSNLCCAHDRQRR
jgi:hypothetical protein